MTIFVRGPLSHAADAVEPNFEPVGGWTPQAIFDWLCVMYGECHQQFSSEKP